MDICNLLSTFYLNYSYISSDNLKLLIASFFLSSIPQNLSLRMLFFLIFIQDFNKQFSHDEFCHFSKIKMILIQSFLKFFSNNHQNESISNSNLLRIQQNFDSPIQNFAIFNRFTTDPKFLSIFSQGFRPNKSLRINYSPQRKSGFFD